MCVGCKRRGEKCQWRILGSFREANLKVLEPEHPSMKQSASRKQNNKFKVRAIFFDAGLSADGEDYECSTAKK